MYTTWLHKYELLAQFGEVVRKYVFSPDAAAQIRCSLQLLRVIGTVYAGGS
jgi:hypothetical protein